MSESRGRSQRDSGEKGEGLVNSLVTRWQTLFSHVEQTRAALAEVEANRDDMIAYLSTLRVVMGVLERARHFDQVCQEIAEAIVVEIGSEVCALAIRERPEEQFQLLGFATRSQRLGEPELDTSIAESSWLTAAALIAASGQKAFYRQASDGTLAAVPDVGSGAGFLGLPFEIGGERNGVLVIEYAASPGQRFACRAALSLVADVIGGALTIARTRDATARVLADLEREVGATRDALSKSEESLREKEDSVASLTQAVIRSNQAKREFLGTLSHELRTPLNAILGYSELLHDGLVGPVTADQTAMLDRVMVSARHLTQLIEDMLFFVQLDTSKVAVQRRSFSLGDLVSEVAASVPERFSHREAALRVEVARGSETVWCDRVLLKRVIFHLLGNAFKFTERGEVSLTATPWESGQGVAIVVRDTGVGISEARLGEIFEVFRQLDMSETRRFSGVGLGLALVKRCVQILGGQIQVKSVVGKGSEFTVHLPSTEPALQPAPQPTQLQP